MTESLISTLTSPISDCVESYTQQFEALNALVKILNLTSTFPVGMRSLLSKFNQDELQSNLQIQEYLTRLDNSAAFSRKLLLKDQNTLLYPYLVGSWTTLEVAFNDLVERIVLNDPEISNKLLRHQFKYQNPEKNESEAKKIVREIRNRIKSEKKLGICNYHKAFLEFFDLNLEYSDNGAKVIEEINLIRNCIVHNNGIAQRADLKISNIPITLGKPIPSNNIFFIEHSKILVNYLVAWIAAIAFAYAPMQKDAKNPFQTP